MDIGGQDLIFENLIVKPKEAFRIFVLEFLKLWPHAVCDVFYDLNNFEHFTNPANIDFSKTMTEILIYKDSLANDLLEQMGCTEDTVNLFVHGLSYKGSFTIVVDDNPDPEIMNAVERVKTLICG